VQSRKATSPVWHERPDSSPLLGDPCFVCSSTFMLTKTVSVGIDPNRRNGLSVTPD
jgi:hypothetical protein